MRKRVFWAFVAFWPYLAFFGCSSAFWGVFHAFWGSVIIMGDIYGSNFFFAHFENSNFGQFAIFLANLRYFWPWRSSEGPKGPDLVPTATDWSDWAGIMVTTHFGLVSGLFWATRDPKRAFLASKRPQNHVFGRFLQLDGPK